MKIAFLCCVYLCIGNMKCHRFFLRWRKIFIDWINSLTTQALPSIALSNVKDGLWWNPSLSTRTNVWNRKFETEFYTRLLRIYTYAEVVCDVCPTQVVLKWWPTPNTFQACTIFILQTRQAYIINEQALRTNSW